MGKPRPAEVVELHAIPDVRRWFAVVNNPDRSRPWITRAVAYVPGTDTDPYVREREEPSPN